MRDPRNSEKHSCLDWELFSCRTFFLKNKKTAIRTVQVQPGEATSVLQHNFDNTEWDLFAEESGLEVHAG